MARPLSRRWIAIAGGMLVVALILVAAVLSSRDDEPPGNAVSEPSSTVQATDTPAPIASSGATAGASVGAPTGESGTSSGEAAPGPAGESPVPSPREPAAAGSVLTTITTPPARTLAMIEADRATANSRYDVTFQVYGFGPGGSAMALVVKVGSSNPIGAIDQPYDFRGRNVLVRLGQGGEPVTIGGTYRGVIQLRPDGSVLVPVLSDVRKDS